jgi:phosphohistidine phosphatase
VIYLIRHAKAEPGEGLPDSDRKLTDQGRREAADIALALKKLEAPIEAVLSSPYARALETAHTIGAKLGVPVAVRDRMASGASPADLLDVVKAEGRTKNLALVGHNPEIGIFAALLVALVPGGTVNFKPGSVCCVELAPDKDAGRLVWFRNPDDLAAIAARP